MYRAVFCLIIALLTFGAATVAAAEDDREACRNHMYEVGGAAIAPCSHVIDRNPNDADAYFSRGVSYNARGWEIATKDWNQALRDFDRAIADFSSAIRLRPNHARAYSKRGEIYYFASDYDRAIADFDQSIRLDPTASSPYEMRASTYAKKRDFDRAIADYNEVLKLYGPSSSASYDFVSRGDAYLAKGDYDRAIADYDEALKRGLSDEKAKEARQNREHAQALLLTARQNPTKPVPPTAVLQQPPSPPAVPERRVALVIGMSRYANVSPLANPVNDARAVADAFRRLGFAEVIEREDLTRAGMEEVLKAFGDKAAEADWAVIYYAGHGVEMNGVNYLVPVDATLARADHVEDETVTLTRVLSKAELARKLRMVIIDACRNNPFRLASAEGRPRAVGRGLSPVEPVGGVLVAYAARGGTLADDGMEGHSPFTRALLTHLETPGLDIRIMFSKVRDSVLASTNNVQEPFTYGSLPGQEFYFKQAVR